MSDYRRRLMMLLASRPKGPLTTTIEFINDKVVSSISGSTLNLSSNIQYSVVHITNLDPSKEYTLYCPLGAYWTGTNGTVGKDASGNWISGSTINETAQFTGSSSLAYKLGVMHLPSGIKELWSTWCNVGTSGTGVIHRPCNECFALRETADTEPIELYFNASGMNRDGLMFSSGVYHNYYIMYNAPTGDCYFPTSAWADSDYYTTVCLFKKSLNKYVGYTGDDIIVTSFYDNSDGDVAAILVQLPDT